MIKGMTGFGSTEVSNGQIKAIVEIKSLNHRYFDISYYLPIGFASVENKIRQLVQKDIERGRVTVSIKITQKPMEAVALNKAAIKKYLHFTKAMAREFGLNNDISLSDLIKLPGVWEAKETIVKPEQVWTALEASLKKSIKALLVMKKREGNSLTKDVNDKLRRMNGQISKIKGRYKVVVQEGKRTLTMEEFTVFQKGYDINEEISRLTHYIDEIKRLLRSNVAVGKRVDFIAQEMQRETNTIGSKMQDKIISNAVISLKSKIEKIREQAQNIE